MPHLTALPPRERSQDSGPIERPKVPSDAEIQAMLECERAKMLETVNYLEALYAKLARSSVGGPLLSIVESS
jgi:hypothetical protein